ncbi:MAG: DNA primase [Eubacteriales bacterium]
MVRPHRSIYPIHKYTVTSGELWSPLHPKGVIIIAFPSGFIDELKYRNDLEGVIGRYVTLKRAGSNSVGCCPFHSEKTPSFTVFSATRSFFCFGCGAGGDVITFIMRAENLDYMSAVERLCSMAGMQMPEDGQDGTQSAAKRKRILEMNREAAKYYYKTLFTPQGEQALGYLTGRGLSTATIKHFGLGYSPDSWDSTKNAMTSAGFTPEEMREGFLCGVGKSGSYYDYFRNRVIFPIIDLQGQVIAFGGRVMDSSMPKYLNTSDTPAFKKSRNLFGLNFAKNDGGDTLILCEGYMDTIALHQAGFTNSVATLGTAITSEHARIIAKYAKKAVLAYDSDNAGQGPPTRHPGCWDRWVWRSRCCEWRVRRTPTST